MVYIYLSLDKDAKYYHRMPTFAQFCCRNRQQYVQGSNITGLLTLRTFE